MTPDLTQLELIRRLASGEWVSGADLATALNLSREAVSKRVRRLSAWGLTIASQSGRGYRLETALELLDPTAITAGLKPSDGRVCPVTVLTSVDSTNRWLSQNADGLALCLAEHQSAGRGRRGREWHSPLGQNLYLSLRVDLPTWPEKLPALGLALGVALCDELNAQGIPMALKWPNDLYLGGRKCGGLLIEQRGEAHGGCTLIIGLGMNVAMREGAIDQAWTSLALEGYAPGRNALCVAMANTLLNTCHELDQGGIESRLKRFAEYDIYRDQPIRIDAPDRKVAGASRGIDDWGRLRVATDRGLEIFSVGDVSLRPVA